jgi:hypothetical protein
VAEWSDDKGGGEGEGKGEGEGDGKRARDISKSEERPSNPDGFWGSDRVRRVI